MLNHIAIFIISLLGSLLIILFGVLFWMQAVNVHHKHPVTQLIYSLSAPITRHLKRITITKYNLDVVSALLILVIGIIMGASVSKLQGIPIFELRYYPALLITWLIDTLTSLLRMVFFVIIGASLSTMFAPQSLATPFLHQLSRPLLKPIQKIVPLINRQFDISPMIVCILITIINFTLTTIKAYLQSPLVN